MLFKFATNPFIITKIKKIKVPFNKTKIKYWVSESTLKDF